MQTALSQHQDIIQLAYYAFVLLALWFSELAFSNDIFRSKMRHTGTNLLFIFTALPIQLGMIGLVLLVSSWTDRNHWGLINYLPFHQNRWVYFVSLFIMLDLGEYTYHVIMHKVHLLWIFHLVHHSDRVVDVSTTVREHPGETVVRTGFLMLWVFLLGPAASVLVLRQTVQTFSNITSHTNFRLPERLNRIIGFVFITPNLHHVHHHYQLPYTDRNYGDVLSIWDRLFGTYAELGPKETVFGVDTHMPPEVNGHFGNILKMPFTKPMGIKIEGYRIANKLTG